MPGRAFFLTRSLPVLAGLVLLLFTQPACLVRKLKIIRPGIAANAKLQNATLQDLLGRLEAVDKQIRTLNATVDMEPSIGSVNKGEISEFKEVRGFILLRKPETIRMIGLYPVVRNRAFDMVSDGDTFKLYVPAKNKFIVGSAKLIHVSANKLENLRPQHIMEALVVRPPHDGERAVLQNLTDEAQAFYIIHMLRDEGGRLLLRRNVWFDRVTLRVVRQETFDETGDIAGDTRYEEYHGYDGVQFPKKMAISRPKEEYGVKLEIQKLELNQPLEDEKFALAQPPGSDLMRINGAADAGSDGPAASQRKPGGPRGQ